MRSRVGFHAHFLGAVLLDYHAGEKKEKQKDTRFLCDLVFNACMLRRAVPHDIGNTGMFSLFTGMQGGRTEEMTSLVCLYRIPNKYSIMCPENFNFLLLSASVVDLEYCFVFLSTRDSYLCFFYVMSIIFL